MSTYAIIELGGKQLRVEPGRFYDTNHFSSTTLRSLGQNNKMLIFRVLMIRHGLETSLGHPWLKDAAVKIRLLHHSRQNKVIIYKMNAKKKTRRKNGHRQHLGRFIVDAIEWQGKNLYST
uniref:Large ribosomal subunit protein bL21c n=1 Tax=Coleochaete scutata TaxID=3125 RepID=A0A191T5M0_COLSC|nr:ribosomal protein L21 [Coleochaete scutata]ANI25701.1 ribosomal protein L21 [Coleochaete scutata]